MLPDRCRKAARRVPASTDGGSWRNRADRSQHNKFSFGFSFLDLCNTCQGIKVGVNTIFPINTNTGQGLILSAPLKKQALACWPDCRKSARKAWPSEPGRAMDAPGLSLLCPAVLDSERSAVSPFTSQGEFPPQSLHKFISSSPHPQTCCFSYFSITVIKYCDQKQLAEYRVYVSLQRRGLRGQHG